MARQYGIEKVSLVGVLWLIATSEDAPSSGELVQPIMEYFGCARRAAIDAIAILRKAGCIGGVRDEADRRRIRYVVTARGFWCLRNPFGGMLLRYARKLFTTCGSPEVRRFQQSRADGRSPEDAFADAERSLREHASGAWVVEHHLALEREYGGLRIGGQRRVR